MHLPSGKKILLIGFIIALLVAIPLAIYFFNQQQAVQTSSVPSTTLAFTPSSESVNLGEDVSLDVNVDPGSNSVSFVKALISYDATKLATSASGFVPNTTDFPSIIQGPTYGPGTISITISIGATGTPVQKLTRLGTLTLKAIAPTDSAPSQITFGNQTQVLSIGATDQFNENVLSTTTPATITIVSSATPTPIPTEIPITTLTPTPADTQSGTGSSSDELSLTSPADAAEAPICSSFTADRALSGTVPYNVNFTLIGTTSATVVKATFNFGDGTVTDLTQADGIGLTSVNALTSHIYNTPGTFSAFGTLTDANGVVSQVGTCTLILTINASGSAISDTSVLPSPLPPTGPSQLITIGAIGIIITLIAAALLFAL